MNDNHGSFKMIFGGVIFFFSCAFAFFFARFIDPSGEGAYSLILFIIGVLFVIIGIAVLRIMAISLSFLFSADVVILYLLANDFAGYGNLLKIVVVGLCLASLFYYAWYKLEDPPNMATPATPVSPPPPPDPAS